MEGVFDCVVVKAWLADARVRKKRKHMMLTIAVIRADWVVYCYKECSNRDRIISSRSPTDQ